MSFCYCMLSSYQMLHLEKFVIIVSLGCFYWFHGRLFTRLLDVSLVPFFLSLSLATVIFKNTIGLFVSLWSRGCFRFVIQQIPNIMLLLNKRGKPYNSPLTGTSRILCCPLTCHLTKSCVFSGIILIDLSLIAD